MPVSAMMVGALLGLGTQMYSNALRKLPYMRLPPDDPPDDPLEETKILNGGGMQDTLDEIACLPKSTSEEFVSASIKSSLVTRSPPMKQVINLDTKLGSSAVIVVHEEDCSVSESTGGDNEQSERPFLLVSNRKGSRKAAKA
ncbi:unnamed protein product [Eruca vesicaria subsp. sativa]|uniref:Uncharacterized protein n=1 Tax=Eruca vesicaria subsp. sativa TaxID=29727 RepID=A0ABC8M4K9_ERUVS|nr:unnamed protein product [Eruca vesicaria subsp. sativa]